MQRLRAAIQHRLNAVHVYCLLRHLGLRPAVARSVATAWEGTPLYGVMYGSRKEKRRKKRWQDWRARVSSAIIRHHSR